VLQKSKVAPVQIFGETLKRDAIDDSNNLSRATEVAYEFCVRRRGPSDPYTKTASAALGIFDTFGKTTFARLSGVKQTSHFKGVTTVFEPERTLAQGEPTSTSACSGEVDAGSPSRNIRHSRIEAAGLEQVSILVSCASLVAPTHSRRAPRPTANWFGERGLQGKTRRIVSFDPPSAVPSWH
jgi:hypothetical protein